MKAQYKNLSILDLKAPSLMEIIISNRIKDGISLKGIEKYPYLLKHIGSPSLLAKSILKDRLKKHKLLKEGGEN